MEIPWRSLAAGAAAGCIGSTVQAGIGKTLEKLILPPHEDADIAPRMVKSLARQAGVELTPAEKWVAGTIFHYGYGAGWGTAYSLVRERVAVSPAVGGGVMGGIIYGITFPRWGLATQTETERPPRRRSAAMELVAVAVAVGFGLVTARAYEGLRPKPR